MHNNMGTLYGVGVGPGDPELITLKAIRIIDNSDVLIFPGRRRESCRAYQILSEAYSDIDKKQCVFKAFPMTMNKEELNSFHHNIADEIYKLLQAGKKVCFLTIGDPSIYSTFEYIASILENIDEAVLIERVSGITSFCAVASRLNISLALEDELIHVIPGSADTMAALELKGTKVFMKSGKRLADFRRVLIEYERSGRGTVMSVSNCGMDNEIVARSANEIPTEGNYLTVIIVR